jgi:hypothetical protein
MNKEQIQKLDRAFKLYIYLCDGGEITYKGQKISMSEDDQIGYVAYNDTTPDDKFLIGCSYPTVKYLLEIVDSLTIETWLHIVECYNKNMYEEVMFKEMRSFNKEESKAYKESLNK